MELVGAHNETNLEKLHSAYKYEFTQVSGAASIKIQFCPLKKKNKKACVYRNKFP